MKVAVIGGTGRAGSKIVEELARRGHQVTALARHPEKAPTAQGVTAKAADIHDAKAMTEALKGHDVVVSALRFLDATPAQVIGPVKASGVGRYLVVGGAASLLSGGQRLFDSPHFPEAYKPEAGAGIAFLEALKAEPDLDWTFLSPSMIFDGNERVGKFRLGQDDLLVAADGKSSISFPDFAIAMADEIENPRHRRRRFTVGY
ncbi:MAG: NAD(P)-dependent oxidoreductase [Caulobacteraceae bacterium]